MGAICVPGRELLIGGAATLGAGLVGWGGYAVGHAGMAVIGGLATALVGTELYCILVPVKPEPVAEPDLEPWPVEHAMEGPRPRPSCEGWTAPASAYPPLRLVS